MPPEDTTTTDTGQEPNAETTDTTTASAAGGSGDTTTDAALAQAREEAKEAREELAKVKNDADKAGDSKTYDETYVSKLREEAAKTRVKLRELENAGKTEAERAAAEAAERLKELEDARKAEADRAEQARKDLEERASASEARLLRVEVATEKKVPLELADRLVGSTKKELLADADRLIKVIQPKSGQGLDQGARGGGPAKSAGGSMNDWLRKQAGVATE